MDSLFGALKSKTIWLAVATAVLGVFVKPVNDWIAANPGSASTVVAAMFGLLRTLTNTSLASKA